MRKLGGSVNMKGDEERCEQQGNERADIVRLREGKLFWNTVIYTGHQCGP